MTVRLLGTGAADGWPNPFCTCPRCGRERLDGRTRAQTAALVDDAVLLDCGPETPQAAARQGVPLDRLRVVLLTHQHSDHFGPSFLLHRSWATGAPLTVAGPPDVVAGCRDWLPVESPVRLTAVRPGDVLDLSGYAVRVLPSSHRTRLGRAGEADAVLYDLTTPAGFRLLYATDTGPLPESLLAAVSARAYHLVLLEETFGDRRDHGTDHLDLGTFPAQLRRLRAVGAVEQHTDVVAVHLSHHNPATAELGRRLADWGARVVDDGTVLDPPAPPTRTGPARTLVIGGARSGKSREAERILADRPDVTYVATSDAAGDDPEWARRVARHRARRPAGWTTLETLDLVGVLGSPGGPVLVDCLTLWLTRVMDDLDAWSDEAWSGPGPASGHASGHASGSASGFASGDDGAEQRVLAAIDDLVSAWRSTTRRAVAVTNEVGQGVVPGTVAGRRFRDLMGVLNARLAAETEDVRWCVAGQVWTR